MSLREKKLKTIMQPLNCVLPNGKKKGLISICVRGKCKLLGTYTLVGFQEDIQQFIPKLERNLSVKRLVAPLAISSNDDVQHNVKHNLNFDELKFLNKIPFKHYNC
jgi:hypothetical protein